MKTLPLPSLLLVAAALGLAACSGHGAATADSAAVSVTLKDHKFSPAEIVVPANQPVVLAVTNADGLAEEFDSDSLKVEKVIAGGQKGLIRIRPLAPGRYSFMGEYNSKTAQGVVIAR